MLLFTFNISVVNLASKRQKKERNGDRKGQQRPPERNLTKQQGKVNKEYVKLKSGHESGGGGEGVVTSYLTWSY